MQTENDLRCLMCCDNGRGVKKSYWGITCLWLIADRSESPNIALVHQASSWDCCQMSPFINILQKNKCRPLPLRWIMNQGWRISVVTHTWMGVWQLQQLQFNPLSAHWNIPNCHNLNSITTDNDEVMSSITAKDTTHSLFWKGMNDPKCFQNVLNVSLV